MLPTKSDRERIKRRLYTIVFLITPIVMLALISQKAWLLAITGVGLYIAWFETSLLYKKQWLLKSLAYPGIPTLTLLWYSIQSSSPLLMLQPWILAWIADIAGYLGGNLFGKHKACPTISPGKTVEGLLISIICVTFAAHGIYGHAYICGIIIGLVAFLGDIFASWLKRNAHIKDTGSLLPGHGGLLDRMDSVYGISLFFVLLYFLNRIS